MSESKGQPANAFSIPTASNLGYEDVRELCVLQATTCIVQTWIVNRSLTFKDDHPSAPTLPSLIKEVYTALSKPLEGND